MIKRILIIGIPVIILVAGIVVIRNTTAKEDFVLAAYVTVDVEGLSGRADARVLIDSVGLEQAFGKIYKDQSTDDIHALAYSVKGTLDKTGEVANGDKLTVSITYDEALAISMDARLDNTAYTYTAKDLQEGTLLDAFADVQIITSGTSPYMYVTYANNSEQEYLRNLTYSFDKSEKVAIGDEITIKCNADEKSAAKQGYYFDTLEITYVIETADRYVTSAEHLDKEYFKGLTQENVDEIISDTADSTSHMTYMVTHNSAYLYMDSNEEAEGFELSNMTLAYNTSGHVQEHENYLLIFYEGTIVTPTYSQNNPYEYLTAYFCYLYDDVIYKADGKTVYTVNNPKYVCGTSYNACLEEAQAEIGQGYDYTDISIY